MGCEELAWLADGQSSAARSPQAVGLANRPRRKRDTGITGGEYDSLTDLFIGPGSDPARPDLCKNALENGERSGVLQFHRDRVGAKQGPLGRSLARQLEVVLPGNVPVLSGAWVSQYGRVLASLYGRPIGFVHVQDGTVRVEVVLLDSRQSGKPVPREHDLSEVISMAEDRFEPVRWIFRVDDPDVASAAALQMSCPVTLLTGADDPAIVGSYGLLKQLVRAWSADRLKRGLRVAVVASRDDLAASAVQRLGRASASFLGLTVSASPVRMGAITGAGELCELYRRRGQLDGQSFSQLFRNSGYQHPLCVEPRRRSETNAIDAGDLLLPPLRRS